MNRHLLPLSLALPFALLGASAMGQVASGSSWSTFGPDRSGGEFFNITREHRSSQNAQGIAVDRQQRILVMNEWRESGSSNIDCALSRHIKDGRLLDMDFTGPEQLEATRRITMDMGGSNLDICTALDSDSQSRPVIVGFGDTGGGVLSGFVQRLLDSGAPDTSFSSDGRIALRNYSAFTGTSSGLQDVRVLPDNRIVACGYIVRAGDRNMLAMRWLPSGALDTSFNGTGVVEVDFNGASPDSDACERLLVLPDGDIFLGGTASDASGETAYGLVRLNTDGSPHVGFSSDGRLRIGDGSQLAATPALVDLAWDAARNRLMVACNLAFSGNLEPAGCVIAVAANGALDSNFDGDGRVGIRFSDIGIGGLREPGGTRLKRLLMRDDGSMMLLGTHFNSSTDAQEFGGSDVVTMRMQADGSVQSGAVPGAYDYHGVIFHSFTRSRYKNVSVEDDRKLADVMVDASWHRGNLLMLINRPRYPAGLFDHDGDGNLDEPGPIAPMVVGINSDHLFHQEFDFDGLDRPATFTPLTSMPDGMGRYCSVRHPTQPNTYGVLAQGAGSDPCQQYLDGNPSLIVERSGVYAMAARNWVLASCDGDFVITRSGNGAAPINAAFNATTGRGNCIFTVTPDSLPIFARPYTGAHLAGSAQSFNHDPYNIAIPVGQFGQSSNGFDACFIDNRGRQRSTGNPNGNPPDCEADGSGVNEAAVDIGVTSTRYVVSVAPGRVVMAVPRHIPGFVTPAMDPYQREVFVRHQIGNGRYAEIFTTYSAHMSDTAVRRGDTVSAGSVLGQVGTTGASTGDHLHLSVIRHRNLSWRSSFELDFDGGRHDRTGSVGAVDPWGWQAPQGTDPWAYLFRDHASNDDLDNAGSFSSWMWLDGEAPTMF